MRSMRRAADARVPAGLSDASRLAFADRNAIRWRPRLRRRAGRRAGPVCSRQPTSRARRADRRKHGDAAPCRACRMAQRRASRARCHRARTALDLAPVGRRCPGPRRRDDEHRSSAVRRAPDGQPWPRPRGRLPAQQPAHRLQLRPARRRTARPVANRVQAGKRPRSSMSPTLGLRSRRAPRCAWCSPPDRPAARRSSALRRGRCSRAGLGPSTRRQAPTCRTSALSRARRCCWSGALADARRSTHWRRTRAPAARDGSDQRHPHAAAHAGWLGWRRRSAAGRRRAGDWAALRQRSGGPFAARQQDRQAAR